MAPTIALLDFR
uniref:Uncharacterized protein n=1 Tax=Rhizophora mucronata TaxID=61149 RepID=A0A2P2KHA8_RHIMU